MGINYYVEPDVCPTCGQAENEPIHIGKSSIGWKFNFALNGRMYYTCVPELKMWLEDKNIVTDHGEKIPNDKFWDIVSEKQGLRSYHEEYGDHPYIDHYLIDDYEFTDGAFC